MPDGMTIFGGTVKDIPVKVELIDTSDLVGNNNDSIFMDIIVDENLEEDLQPGYFIDSYYGGKKFPNCSDKFSLTIRSQTEDTMSGTWSSDISYNSNCLQDVKSLLVQGTFTFTRQPILENKLG
ncbi:MAG: hypothetical protein COT14_02280 [Candidatus Diapherotrites archaeon CG08_land_8_20_14_0_20_30_16]|nr:MAG: hypothetical protein COT14_02280 [Candidatus Diapherotrites archaeon CG08_land_8_20_14_0_20_30_16]